MSFPKQTSYFIYLRGQYTSEVHSIRIVAGNAFEAPQQNVSQYAQPLNPLKIVIHIQNLPANETSKFSHKADADLFRN